MKRRIKRWIQKILLYLLEKLNMPLPFSRFSSQDMLNIHQDLYKLTDYKDAMELYSLPNLIDTYTSLYYDKNNDFGTLSLTRISDKAHAEIVVKNDYSVVVIGLDDNTTNLIMKIVKSYLTRRKFTP